MSGINLISSFEGWVDPNTRKQYVVQEGVEVPKDLVAAFKKARPSTSFSQSPSPLEKINCTQYSYNYPNLDAVLSNPEAVFSPNDRALLQQAQRSYPAHNGGRG